MATKAGPVLVTLFIIFLIVHNALQAFTQAGSVLTNA